MDTQKLIGTVVRFTDRIEEMEAQPDSGQLARIRNIVEEGTDRPDLREHVYRIVFDYSEFETHNDALARGNYYDKHGNPCLTAKQADQYRPQETVYFGSPTLWPWEDYFEAVDPAEVLDNRERDAALTVWQTVLDLIRAGTPVEGLEIIATQTVKQLNGD